MDTDVLLCTDTGSVHLGYGFDYPYSDENRYYWCISGGPQIFPTHWMPLPEPPNDAT